MFAEQWQLIKSLHSKNFLYNCLRKKSMTHQHIYLFDTSIKKTLFNTFGMRLMIIIFYIN